MENAEKGLRTSHSLVTLNNTSNRSFNGGNGGQQLVQSGRSRLNCNVSGLETAVVTDMRQLCNGRNLSHSSIYCTKIIAKENGIVRSTIRFLDTLNLRSYFGLKTICFAL